MEPKNPIPQFAPKPGMNNTQPPRPGQLPGEPAKKKHHTVWWFFGSCCAGFIIVGIVFVALGARYWPQIRDFSQKFVNQVNNTASNTSTNTYVNEVNVPTNSENTTTNSTNSTNNSTSNNTTSNAVNTPSSSGGSGTQTQSGLISAVIAKGINTKNGSAENVTDTFSTTDTLYYAVIQVSNLKKTDVGVDWYQNGVKVQTYSLAGASGNKFINFYLDVSGSDPDARVGDYQAKIYFGTALKKTLSFTVAK